MFITNGYKASALKYKDKENNPWKMKHINTWGEEKMKFTKYYSTEHPHKVVNDLCDLYVSYGSSQFQYRDNKKNVQTSGYSQLEEFKTKFTPTVLVGHDLINEKDREYAAAGIQIYQKNHSRNNNLMGGKIYRKKTRREKKNKKVKKSKKLRKMKIA